MWAEQERVWWLSSCENPSRRRTNGSVRRQRRGPPSSSPSSPPAQQPQTSPPGAHQVLRLAQSRRQLEPVGFLGFSQTLAERFCLHHQVFMCERSSSSSTFSRRCRRGKMLLTALMRRICSVYLSVTEQLFRSFFCQWWETGAHTSALGSRDLLTGR